MARSIAALSLTVVLWGAVPPAPSSDQAVDQVLDQVLEAYGGVEAIRAVDSHRQDGMLVAVNGGGHAMVTRISNGIGSLSVLVDYTSRVELRIVEGGAGWRGSSPESLAAVRGPLLLAMVAQAARARLPRLLDDLRSQVRLETSETGGDVLVVDLSDALALRLIIDPDTHLVTRTESIFVSMPGPFGFATDYSDHRTVDGIVFPFREETYASGVHTASLVLESVELNPEGARARLPVPN